MRTSYLHSSQRTGLLRYADDYANASNLVIDTAYDYDLMGRLTQIDHTDGTTTIHKFDFTYDAASRIDTFDSSVDGLFDYSYDDTNQLTLVEDDTPTTLESYSYDDNGNRTMTGYATGDYNRMTDDGTYDYEYDNEGNRTRRVHSTSGATRVYQWDHRNRLTAVIDYADETDADADQDRTQTVEHQYDAFNQWIAKTLDADGDGAGASVDEFYVHESGQIAFRLDDSGDVENRYVWDPTAVDQLLADEAVGDELRWSLTDHLGTVRDLVDNAGNVDKHIEYDSFGDITAETATSIDLLFAYTGRPLDDDTGKQNHLHRWYDAPNGTWVSEDPIGFEGGDASLFAYVGNSPIANTDPSGLTIVAVTVPPGIGKPSKPVPAVLPPAGPSVSLADPAGHQWVITPEVSYRYGGAFDFTTYNPQYWSDVNFRVEFQPNPKAPGFNCRQIKLAAIRPGTVSGRPSFNVPVGGTNWSFEGLDYVPGVSQLWHDSIFIGLKPGYGTAETVPNPGQNSNDTVTNGTTAPRSGGFWYNAYLNVITQSYTLPKPHTAGKPLNTIERMFVVGAYCKDKTNPNASKFISFAVVRMVGKQSPLTGYYNFTFVLRPPTTTNATFNAVYKNYIWNINNNIQR